MRKRIDLIIIDPQLDFCGAPGTDEPIYGKEDSRLQLPKGGSLYVPGADEDVRRLADFIRKYKRVITNIRVTLDSHQTVHIAHPLFWVDPDGNPPPFFANLTVDDVKQGRWRAAQPHVRISRAGANGAPMTLQEYALFYVEELRRNDRYDLTIWPPHCHVGSIGTAVHPVLEAALREWEEQFRRVDFVTKGNNPWTEHYSAIEADVPDPTDPTTFVNTRLVNAIEETQSANGLVLWSGEAERHCLANTFSDTVSKFSGNDLSGMVLLADATSKVPNIVTRNDDWVSRMVARGMQVSKTTEIFS